MQPLRHPAFAAAATSLLFLFTLLTPSHAQNITRLLAKHPSFSTFNHYLTQTHLASEINARTTITVLAVDNAAMAELLATHPSTATLKNILSFHVLLDYFGTRKLHQISDGSALAATLFQTTGSATGSSGFVNITNVKGGKVAFGPEDNGGKLDVYFVKSLEEIPYNISIIQISKIIPSDTAAAPTPEPSQVNLTSVMSKHGCKVFADTLLANPGALNTYQDAVPGGLTVFCPVDDPFKAFLPKFKNLSAADKISFLEFFGTPVYESLSMLKTSNGLMNTLATDGARKFDLTVQNEGQEVTLKTKINTVKITATLLDEDPLAIYSIDKVLLPKDLFKEAPTPTPAPAPAPEAESPKSSKSKAISPPAPPSAESPAEGPVGDAADGPANGSARVGVQRHGFLILGLLLGVSIL